MGVWVQRNAEVKCAPARSRSGAPRTAARSMRKLKNERSTPNKSDDSRSQTNTHGPRGPSPTKAARSATTPRARPRRTRRMGGWGQKNAEVKRAPARSRSGAPLLPSAACANSRTLNPITQERTRTARPSTERHAQPDFADHSIPETVRVPDVFEVQIDHCVAQEIELAAVEEVER